MKAEVDPNARQQRHGATPEFALDHTGPIRREMDMQASIDLRIVGAIDPNEAS